jgi:hypothetical protein
VEVSRRIFIVKIFNSLNFAGTSGGSHTVGSRENSRAHARTDPADAQEYTENDRREKKVRDFAQNWRIALPKISVADRKCLARIPYPNFFHPGSRIRIFFIPDPGSTSNNLSILTPKKLFPSSRKYDPVCSSRIRILIFLPIPEPGVKKAPDPESGSATLPKIKVCSTGHFKNLKNYTQYRYILRAQFSPF